MTHNIAGLTGVEHFTASASTHAIPSFQPFNRMAIAIAVPAASGTAGLSAFRFGDDLYNEHVVSVGFANEFGIASLGLKGNYIQYRAEGLPTRSALTLSFGGLATLTPQLTFGGYIININQPTINPLTKEKVVTVLVAGIGFKPSTKVIACMEIEKEVLGTPVFKTGIEYDAHEKISFRTGFNLRPKAGYFGFGMKFRRFLADYAARIDNVFGLSHNATITCVLKGQ